MPRTGVQQALKMGIVIASPRTVLLPAQSRDRDASDAMYDEIKGNGHWVLGE